MDYDKRLRELEALAEPIRVTPSPEAFRAHVGFVYTTEHSFVFPSHSPLILFTAGGSKWTQPDVAVIHIQHPNNVVSTSVYYELAAMGVLMGHLHMCWCFKPAQITSAVQSIQRVYAAAVANLGSSYRFNQET